jgi:SrtB family sortase
MSTRRAYCGGSFGLRAVKDTLVLTKGRHSALTEPLSFSDAFLAEPERSADSDARLASVENLTPEDIKVSNPKPPKTLSEKVADAVRRVVYIASLAVFIVCMLYLARNLIDKARGAEIYGELSADFGAADLFGGAAALDEGGDYEAGASALAVRTAKKSSPSDPVPDYETVLASGGVTSNAEGVYDVGTDRNYNAALAKMKAKLNQYRQRNPDVYGYIYIEGTSIDYVLVQGEDNDYYLDHNYEGDPLVIGSIFVDFRNNRNLLRNFNTVTYGHNLSTGGMYHDVTKFFDPEVFNSTLIWVYTFDGAYCFKPFAVYESRYDYNYFRTSFASTDDFVAFAYEMRGNSKLPSDMEFGPTDRIITLSTCTNTLQTQRYVLQAKLIQVIE